MEVLVGLIVIAAIIWAVSRSRLSLEGKTAARQLGAASHTVSGEFPATCQWCRETALAKKMFILRRDAGSWVAVDARAELAATPDRLQAAEHAKAMFSGDAPGHKRLCSEKCVREFLGSEGVQPQSIDFRTCQYCGGRVLSTAAACQQCGARNAA